MTPNPVMATRFEVNVDGKPQVFWMEYGWAALMSLEDYWGVEEGDRNALLERMKKTSFHDTVFLFQAGLTKHQPTLTEGDVINIMDELGKVGSMREIAKAFELGWKDDETTNGAATEAGTATAHPPNRATRRRSTAASRHT